MIWPFLISPTVQCMCVQTALNALNSPALGWVTTAVSCSWAPGCAMIFPFSTKTPLPTGTSLVATRPLAESFVGSAELALGSLPEPVSVLLPPPQAAVSMPAAPATVIPSTVRRENPVGSGLVFGRAFMSGGVPSFVHGLVRQTTDDTGGFPSEGLPALVAGCSYSFGWPVRSSDRPFALRQNPPL